MCGICCYIGDEYAFKYCYSGIKRLLNRGYDSVGICTIENNNSLLVHKYASVDNDYAENKIKNHICDHSGLIGIAHSRWATHGKKSDINAHPHNDMHNSFSIVHNGIIENYKVIKNNLINKGFTFKSDTDSEVIVNLISYHYSITHDVKNAIINATKELCGTWAIVILYKCDKNTLYCICNGIPLLIGKSKFKNFAMVTSEVVGFDTKIAEYIVASTNDLIIIKKTEFIKIISSNNIYYNYVDNTRNINELEHINTYHTIHEIHEQVSSSQKATNFGKRIIDECNVELDNLKMHYDKLIDVHNIILLGCGTSYHSCCIAEYYFKKLCNFNSIRAYDGSEFCIYDIPNNKTCFIIVSQSGETKDLCRCIDLIKAQNSNHVLLGVINVIDSYITKIIDYCIYTNCGLEIGVASTKSFTSQLIVLLLLSLWFSQKQNINIEFRKQYIEKLSSIHECIDNTIKQCDNDCKRLAKKIYNKTNMFLLGKGLMTYIAREGSLKIKEIGYIHAEGYNSSALKHGSYSLIDKNMCIILLMPQDEYYIRNQSIYEELIARNAQIIYITNDLDLKNDNTISIQCDGLLSEILFVIPLQMLSYYIALEKGHNPDRPRNLAKVVTVD